MAAGRSASPRVRRAPDPATTAVQYVRVDHRRAHILVPEELLHRADVIAVFEEVRREGVPETVTGRPLREQCANACIMHGTLEHGLVRVMSPSVSPVAVTMPSVISVL